MIRKLKKDLSILLAALFGILLVGGLVFLNWDNYRDHLIELRRDVRQEVTQVGLKEIMESGGEALDLESVDYCIFRAKKNGEVELISNHLPELEEEQLYTYAGQAAKNWKNFVDLQHVTYITKQNREVGRVVILISKRQALAESMPAIIGSFILACIGIVILVLLTTMFSQRLVRPVEQMLIAEKSFISNASHELKTPLTIISANAQLLSEEIGDNRNLRYIRQETDRMIAMVNKMLTLMRLDAPLARIDHQRFRVDEALLDVIYPLESVAYEKKLRMDIQVQEGMSITGDEAQMKTVMSILLDNAISYTPERGDIAIKAYIHAKKFYLSVSNSGEPIPQEQREKLFERFFRMDEARENGGNHFGLGLSIAGSIVANHHGKIWVESRNGQNVFQVQLPVAGK